MKWILALHVLACAGGLAYVFIYHGFDTALAVGWVLATTLFSAAYHLAKAEADKYKTLWNAVAGGPKPVREDEE